MSLRGDRYEPEEASEDVWVEPNAGPASPSPGGGDLSSTSESSEEDIISVETVRQLRRMQSAHSVRDGLDQKVKTLARSASTRDVGAPTPESPRKPHAEHSKSVITEVKTDMPPKPASLVAQQSYSLMNVSKREKTLMIVGLALALLMAALDNTIVGTALPKIVADLSGTQDEYSWVVISYLLASTALAPTYGRFADLYGRRNVYFACLIVFVVGSALCGAAQNMIMLIVSRCVQGLGGGGLVGLAFVVIGDIAAPRDRGKYAGILGGMFALASVFGPLAGGLLTDHASWRWCFYINVPISIVAFAMLFFAFKRNKTGRADLQLDVTGTLIMITVVVLVELGISWGGSRYAWDDPLIIILIVVGAWLIVPFVFSQRDAPAPIVPLRLFKHRNFTVAALAGFLLGIPMFAAFVFLPVWFQTVRLYSATDSGVQLLALMFSLIVASIISGGIMSKTGHYRPMLWIGSVLVPVGYGCVYFYDEHAGQEVFIPVQLAIGAGIGMILNVLTTMAQNVVAPEDLAVATTGVTFFRTVGASVGIALFTAVLQATSEAAAEELKTEIAVLSRTLGVGAKPSIEALVAGVALPNAFLFTTPIAILPFFVLLFAQHIPLKKAEEGAAPVAAE